LNGIDDRLWNPETDPLIAARYGVSDLSGKAENKKALLHSFGLDNIHVDWPVLGMLSRIEVQKGFDLVVAILDELLSKDVYFLVLGTGNRETESLLKGIMDQHPDRTGIHSAFDNGSAHLMEAGSDIFLMPSRYEPCGLNQMYSLRYGTVPIVRSTGGLADTVQEFDPATAEGTGFCFRDYDPEQFRTAIDRALNLWQHQELWRRLMLNGMNQNFSWNESATKYLDVYGRVASKRRSS
jgi:starch synthase